LKDIMSVQVFVFCVLGFVMLTWQSQFLSRRSASLRVSLRRGRC
jgi:hypothetical protein